MLSPRGPNHFADKLTATCFEEEHLSFGQHAGGLRCEFQQIPNCFADGRAARFARDQRRIAEILETLGQPFHLRGFPAAFRSFESDKDSARHGSEFETCGTDCRIRTSD